MLQLLHITKLRLIDRLKRCIAVSFVMQKQQNKKVEIYCKIVRSQALLLIFTGLLFSRILIFGAFYAAGFCNQKRR